MRKWYVLSLFILCLMIAQPGLSQDTEVPPEETTAVPTDVPTVAPTDIPTEPPTPVPTDVPTDIPTVIPTDVPTDVPTAVPTETEVVTTEATTPAEVTEEATEVVIEGEVTEEATAEATEAVVEVTEEATAEVTPDVGDETDIGTGDTQEVILNYNPGASEEAVQTMLAQLGATEIERIPQIGAMRVHIAPRLANTTAAVNAIQSNTLAVSAGLVAVEPNYTYQLTFPNDPLFGSYQPNLQNGNPPSSIWMETGWSLSLRDGLGVTVAVLDSGVDLQHPEFAGKLVPGWDFANDDNNPDDDNGHGTHVAGIIAARTNNLVGIASIAYNSMILPVKVCTFDGYCQTYETSAGIIYAVDRGAKVINMSLGGFELSTTMQGAINYALARNVVVVASAGNSGTTEYSYPASYPGVISVGAMDEFGNVAGFSTSNDRVTVSAPGVNILSTFPINMSVGYEYLSGTSMAAPHVAGLAAVLIADGIATTPATVREALVCGAYDINDGLAGGTEPGYDIYTGYGNIQADWTLTWRYNSSTCQVSQPNDLIQNATLIPRFPFTLTQTVNIRSVTATNGDPTACGITGGQTLWYTFRPTVAQAYQLSTLGSSYDTVLGVYEGMPGSLLSVACDDDGGPGAESHLYANLRAGTTYYIMVGTFGGGVTQGLVQLNIAPAIANSLLQQEIALGINYAGTWNRVAQVGSSGGYVNRTTDNTATASFVARGTYLYLSHTVGPDRGNIEVWVDGVLLTTIPGGAAVVRNRVEYIPLSNTGAGQWHKFVLRRAAASVGSIDIDTIQVYDYLLPAAVVTARVNELAPQFTNAYWNGSFYVVGASGALANNLVYTSDVNAFVQFRATGSNITFYRMTGVGTGTMAVYVDNVLIATVDNSALPAGVSVPYSIANMTPRERIVRIVNLSGTLYFDGASANTQAILTAGVIADERNLALAYTGVWARTTNVLALASTLSTSSPEGEVEFMFTANHLCIGFQRHGNGGSFEVYIDGNFVGSINTNGVLANRVTWCTYDNGINTLTDAVHSVRIRTFTSLPGQQVTLDFVQPVRRTVFTASMGLIPETHTGITYNTAYGTWTTIAARSVGGYTFQGGFAKTAGTTGQRLTFTINGTGFILYTSVAPEAGAWSVYVDGVLLSIDAWGGPYTYVDLYNDVRFRPMGIGITNLSPGVHVIELRSRGGSSFLDYYVDFDGFRVLP